VLVRKSSDSRPLENLQVEKFYGDVRDADSIRKAIQGVNLVVHSAAKVEIGWTQLDEFRAINVGGTRHVAQAARENGVRMVHVSSVDALGIRTQENPADEECPPDDRNVLTPYVITKREAEQVLQEEVAKGLNAVIVNPALMLGPWDWRPSSGRALLHVAKGRAWLAPPEGNNIVDVRDVAWGILAAAERGRIGCCYILGGENLTYFEAFTLFAEITGARKPLGITPHWVLGGIGRMGDLWGKVTHKEPEINSAAIAFAYVPHYFSSERARKELGYSPRPVREAATSAWKWFKQHGYA
ncbi:MAG: NAD-dependent epimerase/dehydratase family protein, partial [Deltaproteobacteria bacterium]|nr:NAD-dependent epimerase/dehydratase family protein [Deltaproteobacteria bacterium]